MRNDYHKRSVNPAKNFTIFVVKYCIIDDYFFLFNLHQELNVTNKARMKYK